MYYAYFTYGKGPVYLYDYIDKILQGGTKDATQMITDNFCCHQSIRRSLYR